ncbi:hypothetical protein [Wenzhouxiangella sp. EGI_FJ10409]|uniref:hypothetical protein n=1 Tax=Wenzhouxiangella sp. EGI_FJ10409 TaxID=3243767 RepID=UPI0035DCF736
MSKRNLLLLFVVMFWLIGCATTAPVLESPRQVSVPAAADAGDVEDAVIDALRTRGWAVAERSDGRIVADLNVRAHFARIDIRYDADSVTLEYVDSRNLEYEVVEGEERIHGNFNSWMTNLVNDIQRSLSFVE